MQEITNQRIETYKASFEELSNDEKQRLINAFVWLIEQDKKQNPAFYQNNKKQNDRYSMPTDT
jgi:hypothetical protein